MAAEWHFVIWNTCEVCWSLGARLRQRGHCVIARFGDPAPRATQPSGLVTVSALTYLIMNFLPMQTFSDMLLTCSQPSLVTSNLHFLEPLPFGSIGWLSIGPVEVNGYNELFNECCKRIPTIKEALKMASRILILFCCMCIFIFYSI